MSRKDELFALAEKLTPAQKSLLLALSGKEFRDWGASGMPGTNATRKKIEHLTIRESARFPWMRKLNETGIALRALAATEQ